MKKLIRAPVLDFLGVVDPLENLLKAMDLSLPNTHTHTYTHTHTHARMHKPDAI